MILDYILLYIIVYYTLYDIYISIVPYIHHIVYRNMLSLTNLEPQTA